MKESVFVRARRHADDHLSKTAFRKIVRKYRRAARREISQAQAMRRAGIFA